MDDPLKDMTQAKWDTLSPAQRDAIRSNANLSPQLVGLEGKRVEVATIYDATRRFYVGRSTGWIPCHIEISRCNARGGPSADREYKSVRVIQGTRR